MTRLRVALFNLWFIGLTLVLGVAGIAVRLLRPALAFDLARLWIRLALGGLRAICGLRIAVVGREHLPAGALIVASQHRSALDALVWFTLVDRPSYVMKQELRRLPLVGPLLEPAGMIAVDRAGGAQALRRMLRAAGDALAAGRQVVIFPEGTRAHDRPVELAPGIAALAARFGPVVPVATNSGLAWGPGLLLRPGPAATGTTISIVVGPPLPAAMKRETLLRALEAAWRRGEAQFR